MPSLDRFDSTLLDNTESYPECFGQCKCGEYIYAVDSHIKLDDEVYCDVACLIRGLGAEVIE